MNGEKVTDLFRKVPEANEEEKEKQALEAIRSFAPSEEVEAMIHAELSNGKGSDEEEAAYEQAKKSRSMVRAVGSAYTNSPLVSYTCLSPNHSGLRTHSIDRITIHMVWGQCTMAALGSVFLPSSREASSNYGACIDGTAMFVEEKNRSWCSSSAENDQRAITIETASDTFYPYAVRDDVYKRLIDLCVDICKRNGKKKLLWFGDRNKALSYAPKADEMVLTLHKWFAATECPGQYLESRMGDIAARVTARLTINYPKVPFSVKVLIDDLQVRSSASIDNSKNVIGIIPKGNYIVEKISNNMGYLGRGWIYLANEAYVKVGEHVEKNPFPDMKADDEYYKYMKALYDAGIIGLNKKGRIEPDAKVKKKELCKYLYRIMQKAKLL